VTVCYFRHSPRQGLGRFIPEQIPAMPASQSQHAPSSLSQQDGSSHQFVSRCSSSPLEQVDTAPEPSVADELMSIHDGRLIAIMAGRRMAAIAFSSKADTCSREEDAPKRKTKSRF
jgi:hypothetical protein